MRCPGCSREMVQETLEGYYAIMVTVDLCPACAAFWFDATESLSLTPGAILRLFAIIHDNPADRRNPLPEAPTCPRCDASLAWITNMQRSTRFRYARCPNEHGRFITFVDFLREKNFVRPLSPAEVHELRQRIRTVTCSGCGAPVDLEKGSVCGYCRAPVSMLDAKQVETTVQELRRAEETRRTVDPTWPLRIRLDKLQVERAFGQLGEGAAWCDIVGPREGGPVGLVEAGLAAVVRLLRAVG